MEMTVVEIENRDPVAYDPASFDGREFVGGMLVPIEEG